MDAAEGDDVAVHALGRLGEGQGVAHEVRQVLDLGLLVVVGQEHGVALALELADRLLEIVGEPFIRDIGRGCAAHGPILAPGPTAR